MRLAALLVLAVLACDEASRRGDTTAVQVFGKWEWRARIVVTADPSLTVARMRIDTTGRGPLGDVILARFDADPSPGLGDEYSLTVGLEFGNIRVLRQGLPYRLGAPPAPVTAYATVACLCEPLRADSVQGTFLLVTRGMRQITGRLDATVYFTEWNNAARHATFSLHQRIDAIK